MGFETPITIEKVIQGIQENKMFYLPFNASCLGHNRLRNYLFLMRGYPIGSFYFGKSAGSSQDQFYL